MTWMGVLMWGLLAMGGGVIVFYAVLWLSSPRWRRALERPAQRMLERDRVLWRRSE